MKAHLLLASIAAVFAGVVCAQEKSAAQDLPPIPFILGGDDVVPLEETTVATDIAHESSTQTAVAASPAPAESLAEKPVATATAEGSAVAIAATAPAETASDKVDETPALATTDATSTEAVDLTDGMDLDLAESTADETSAQTAPVAIAATTPAEAPKAEVAPVATKEETLTLAEASPAKETQTAALPTVLTTPQVEVTAETAAPATAGSLSMGDLEETAVVQTAPAEPISESQAALNKKAETEGAMSLTPVPVAPVVAQVPEQTEAAPVVAASAAPAKITDFGPSYALVMPPVIVEGVDGSRHVQGLEHNVGTADNLLPVVEKVSPIIAEVGTEFPELHVNNIPLPDLLAYLRSYTPKNLIYALQEPIAVSVDLKAKSVEEVLEYIKAHYAVETIVSGDNIILREALQLPLPPDRVMASLPAKADSILSELPLAVPAAASQIPMDVVATIATAQAPVVAAVEAPKPIAADVVATAPEAPKAIEPKEVPALAGLVAAPVVTPEVPAAVVTATEAPSAPADPAVVVAASTAIAPDKAAVDKEAAPIASTSQTPSPDLAVSTPEAKEDNSWAKFRREAQLEELAAERRALLAEQQKAQRQIRNYNISRRMD